MKRLTMFLSISLFLPSLVLADQTKDFEHRANVKPSQRIEIKGLSGANLVFTPWDRNEIYVKINVRISSSDEDYEKKYVESFGIEEYGTEQRLVLQFREPSRVRFGLWDLFKGGSYVRKEIRGEVFVPRGNPLTTDLSYGELEFSDLRGEVNILGKNNILSVRNCANLHEVTNNYGKSHIEGGGGSLDLTGTSSQVTVTKFAGSVIIDAPYSTITTAEIGKPVTIKSQSGTLVLSDIGGAATINSPYSNITVSKVMGPLDISTKSGTIRVKDVQGLVVDAPYTNVQALGVAGKPGKDILVKGQSGSISLENVTGNVVMDCPYSPVDLQQINGSVDLTTKSSRVEARDISGSWKSGTEYSTITLHGLKSTEVNIINKSGDVDIDLAVVPSTIRVRNEYAGVSVRLPKGFSGDIALDAEYGRIKTDFSIRSRNRGSSGYAIGKVGSGTGSITIETKSGNIGLIQK